MLKICELFAIEYHVTLNFNESKTVAIKFGSKSQVSSNREIKLIQYICKCDIKDPDKLCYVEKVYRVHLII